MDFPIIDLLDEAACVRWLETHFHPDGLHCPHCEAARDEAREFRQTRDSRLQVYRCQRCDGVYNLYSGTVFEGSRLTPRQVVLVLRGVLQGKTSTQLAREIGLTKKTVLKWRHRLQAQAEAQQTQEPLPDAEAEVDEVFQNAGEKGLPHEDPDDPPRPRAKSMRGRGTLEQDRPPIAGAVGRASGQVRLRVVPDTTQDTLHDFVHQFTQSDTHVYTDDLTSYHGIQRSHTTVSHGDREWARDETDDGQHRVHINSTEGRWTGLRSFLRPFRGVSKHLLSGYVALYEMHVNLKAISIAFITNLVGLHPIYT